MPYLKTPELIQAGVIAALERFAKDARTHPVTMAVLWFEPEHDCWGLNISTQPNACKSTPTEFNYQNYEVGDVLDADEIQAEDLHQEVDAFARRLSRAVPEVCSPPCWGVQVAFEYFVTWETAKNN